jgi:hypothetical protein
MSSAWPQSHQKLQNIAPSRLAQVRSGGKQLVEHGGLLADGQGVQRRPLIVHMRSFWGASS